MRQDPHVALCSQISSSPCFPSEVSDLVCYDYHICRDCPAVGPAVQRQELLGHRICLPSSHRCSMHAMPINTDALQSALPFYQSHLELHRYCKACPRSVTLSCRTGTVLFCSGPEVSMLLLIWITMVLELKHHI